jgi:hypothetical protein
MSISSKSSASHHDDDKSEGSPEEEKDEVDNAESGLPAQTPMKKHKTEGDSSGKK